MGRKALRFLRCGFEETKKERKDFEGAKRREGEVKDNFNNSSPV
jgi:hypothetical protein